MSAFTRQLSKHAASRKGRSWLFVPYDQLTDALGPLSREKPETLGIVLVENRGKANTRPYHKQKLALVLANLRHFALEQAERGVAVEHLFTDGAYRDALGPFARKHGPLRMMEAAEHELREDLAPLMKDGLLKVLPHEGWLTSAAQFEKSQKPGKPFRMDAFYRQVRQDSGILMQEGKPEGGQYSFDTENRKPWKGTPPAPSFPTFTPDEISLEVKALVEKVFADHPGRVDLTALPSTKADAERLWRFAKKDCLPHFGPYEDAMSVQSRGLFHTRISMLLNLHRLLPERMVREAEKLPIPLAGKEGFIRQILGWREFVRHVHVATDGFRRSTKARDRGLAAPSFLGAQRPLPKAFWGTPSGLHCLDDVVTSVWEDGYSHHITRLMVLSNLATLLDISPRELTDWFWVAYVDAFDWVVEPNVLGMGTFAVGELMVTKPYVSGAPYIHRMSDYCQDCQFKPDKTCPITPMYWAFLARNEEKLGKNPRLLQVMASLKKRSAEKKALDAKTFEWVSRTLQKGEALKAGELPRDT